MTTPNIRWVEVPGVGFAAELLLYARMYVSEEILRRDEAAVLRAVDMEIQAIARDLKADAREQYRMAREALT